MSENTELSKALRICARTSPCPKVCPRYGMDIDGAECARRLMEDTAAVLIRPRPNNPALTLDELRQMDGEPVWVEPKLLYSFWGICVDGHVTSGSGLKMPLDTELYKFYRYRKDGE